MRSGCVKVTDLLRGLGISGLPALAILAAGWIVARANERIATRREAELNSQLRQVEARLTARLQAQSTLDVDLRDRRVAVYGVLWSLGGLISRWPRNETLTYAELDTLHLQLKDWYFEQRGGLWLSSAARAAYGRLQEELNQPRAGAGPELVATDGPEYDRLMDAFSALRTELTEDLQSRVRQALVTQGDS